MRVAGLKTGEYPVLTPSQIAEALEQQIESLENLVTEVRQAGEASARAEAAYKVEFSKARLTIRATALEKMTVDQVGDEATSQCEELLLQHLIAENFLVSVRESCRLAQTKTDALRSLLATFRNAAG